MCNECEGSGKGLCFHKVLKLKQEKSTKSLNLSKIGCENMCNKSEQKQQIQMSENFRENIRGPPEKHFGGQRYTGQDTSDI